MSFLYPLVYIIAQYACLKRKLVVNYLGRDTISKYFRLEGKYLFQKRFRHKKRGLAFGHTLKKLRGTVLKIRFLKIRFYRDGQKGACLKKVRAEGNIMDTKKNLAGMRLGFGRRTQTPRQHCCCRGIASPIDFRAFFRMVRGSAKRTSTLMLPEEYG